MSIVKHFVPYFCIGLFVAVLSGCVASESGSSAGAVPNDKDAVSGFAPVGQKDGDLEVVSSLPAPPETNNGSDELVAENDLLEVDVFQVDDLDRTVRVDSNGKISLSLIGAVQAKGITLAALEKEIESRYAAQYLQNPEVSVFMKESSGLRVTVDGAVIKPGIYPVQSTSTLLQILALAGGFKDIADETKLYVFRQLGDKKLTANYNVKEIRAGKRQDPRIFGSDVIVAFDSGSKIAAKNLREALGIASSVVRLVPL